MASDHPSAEGKTGTQSRWLHGLRRCAAFLVFVGAVAAYVASRSDQDLRLCSDVVASVGTKALVEQCRPLSLTDLVPLVALSLVLLVPDISELSIPGLGGVKFRMEQQERRQDDLEARLVEVAQTTSVTQSMNVSAPNVIVVNPAAVVEALPGKEEAFRAEVEEGHRPFDVYLQRVPAPLDAEDAAAVMELLAVWSRDLEPWAELGRRLQGRLWRGLTRSYVAGTLNAANEERYGQTLRRVVPDGLSERDLDVVQRWNSVFAEELAFVRGTRNAVAHPGAVRGPEPGAIRDAIVVGRRLADLLASELRTMREREDVA